MIQVTQERKKINEVLTPSKGLFSSMEYDFEFITSSQLDLLFFTLQGERTVAPLINYYIRDGTIDDDSLKEISKVILSYYSDKWDRLKNLLKIEYDPIHNFSDKVTENITDVDSHSEEKTSSTSQTGGTSNERVNNTTDTTTNNLEERLTNDLTKTENNDITTTDTKNLTNTTNGSNELAIQGFNSSSYLNSDKDTQSSTQTETGTDTIAKTGLITTSDSGTSTKANTGTSSIEKTGSITDTLTRELTDSTSSNISISDSHTRERLLSRIGNIGNITTQQMMVQEIELWKWNFINQVLEDVKHLTTLSIYI